MKLNELRNPPKLSAFARFLKTGKDGSGNLNTIDKMRIVKDPHVAAEKMLAADGWKPLGKGLSATVYGNPAYPYVLKVFDNDPAYIKWWQFCKRNQGNKYVPKLRGDMIRLTNDFNVIRLEKLAPIVNSGDTEFWIFIDVITNPYVIEEDDDLEQIRQYITAANKDHIDLHYQNVMLRGNQFVITDPFSGGKPSA